MCQSSAWLSSNNIQVQWEAGGGRRAHLKATGSGNTTCRRPGPGDRAGDEVSTEREPSSLMSPGKGVPSRGVVAAREEFLMAASRAWVTSSSLWARPSGRLSLKDMVVYVAVPSGARAMLYVVCCHVRQLLVQPPTNPGRPRAPGQRMVHVGRQWLASTKGVPAPYPCNTARKLAVSWTVHAGERARFKAEVLLTCDASSRSSGW